MRYRNARVIRVHGIARIPRIARIIGVIWVFRIRRPTRVGHLNAGKKVRHLLLRLCGLTGADALHNLVALRVTPNVYAARSPIA